MYETIRARYLRYYIRDDQLARFVELSVLTQDQANGLIAERMGTQPVSAPENI